MAIAATRIPRAAALAEERSSHEPLPKHEMKTLRPALQIPLGLFGDVRGVVVHNEADAHFFRVRGIQLFQERDEVPAVVGIADNLCDPTCVQIQSGQQRDRPQSLVFIVALVTGMSALTGGRSGLVGAKAWMPGFSS